MLDIYKRNRTLKLSITTYLMLDSVNICTSLPRGVVTLCLRQLTYLQYFFLKWQI